MPNQRSYFPILLGIIGFIVTFLSAIFLFYTHHVPSSAWWLRILLAAFNGGILLLFLGAFRQARKTGLKTWRPVHTVLLVFMTILIGFGAYKILYNPAAAFSKCHEQSEIFSTSPRSFTAILKQRQGSKNSITKRPPTTPGESCQLIIRFDPSVEFYGGGYRSVGSYKCQPFCKLELVCGQEEYRLGKFNCVVNKGDSFPSIDGSSLSGEGFRVRLTADTQTLFVESSTMMPLFISPFTSLLFELSTEK